MDVYAKAQAEERKSKTTRKEVRRPGPMDPRALPVGADQLRTCPNVEYQMELEADVPPDERTGEDEPRTPYPVG